MKVVGLLLIFIIIANAVGYKLTDIDEPDVILDETGLHWEIDSWGSECHFDENEKAMICKITNQWGAFGFKTKNYYNEGTLYVNMKVSKPEDHLNIHCRNRPTDPDYYNINGDISMSNEYEDYYFTIPNFIEFDGAPFQRLAIQEASNKDNSEYNTFYIKKIVYYPKECKYFFLFKFFN